MNTVEKRPAWTGCDPAHGRDVTVYHHICARCGRAHNSLDASDPRGWQRVDAWDDGTVLHCPDCRDHANQSDEIRAGDPPAKTVDFWLVWCPTGATPPRFRHPTQESAEREAERLAATHPGKTFFVLEPRYSVNCGPRRVSYVPLDHDEVPF